MALKKLKRISFLCLVFLTISIMVTSYAAWRPIKPGDHVYDEERHKNQVLATEQLIKQVVNSIQKINNQLINFMNFSGETLVQESKIQVELDSYKQTAAEFSGMMNKNISPDTVFNDIFKPPNDIELNSGEYQAAKHVAILNFLGNTCKDLFNLAYISQNSSQDEKVLQEVMALNPSMPGNLAGKQLKNTLLALEMKQQIQASQIDNAIAAVKTAKVKGELLTENIAERKTKNMIVLSYDPFNPTSEDKQNYQHKPSPGFMKFK